MAIEQGVLKLSPLEVDERRPHLPIDFFLRSLAADRGRQAIGVVLSGNGLRRHRRARGDPGATAGSPSPRTRARRASGRCPRARSTPGVVDFCLPLPALGAELARLARHPYLARSEPVPPTPAGAAVPGQVVALVRASHRRRLRRAQAGDASSVGSPGAWRCARRRTSPPTWRCCGSDPAEVRSLYDDLLIKVTSFFRDEASFDELKAVAFPEILQAEGPGRAHPRLGGGLRHRRGGLLARHLAHRVPRRRPRPRIRS